MGIDIGIFLLSSQISKLQPEMAISVMANLICILCKLPKDAKGSSCGFWIRTYQRQKIRKKTLWVCQNKVKSQFIKSIGSTSECSESGGPFAKNWMCHLYFQSKWSGPACKTDPNRTEPVLSKRTPASASSLESKLDPSSNLNVLYSVVLL